MFLLRKVAFSPAAILFLDCAGNTISVASAFSRCNTVTTTARRGYWKRMLPRNPTTTNTAVSSSVGGASAVVDKPTQEWDVTRYQQQHSFVYQYGASLIDVAAPLPGERILDVGCGSGELTAALAERTILMPGGGGGGGGTTVWGMDADPHMIGRAQAQFAHVPGLKFVQADARSLQLDEPVDLVFSNAALHWIPSVDAERAVASMSRALRVGGRFVVEFGGKGNVQRIVQACEQVTGVPADFWYYPSIADYSTLLQKHGIEVTNAVLYDRPTALEGDEGMKNWVRMFGNKFLERYQSPEQVEEALQKIDDLLRPDMFDGTQWTADYRRIRIVGKKLP